MKTCHINFASRILVGSAALLITSTAHSDVLTHTMRVFSRTVEIVREGISSEAIARHLQPHPNAAREMIIAASRRNIPDTRLLRRMRDVARSIGQAENLLDIVTNGARVASEAGGLVNQLSVDSERWIGGLRMVQAIRDQERLRSLAEFENLSSEVAQTLETSLSFLAEGRIGDQLRTFNPVIFDPFHSRNLEPLRFADIFIRNDRGVLSAQNGSEEIFNSLLSRFLLGARGEIDISRRLRSNFEGMLRLQNDPEANRNSIHALEFAARWLGQDMAGLGQLIGDTRVHPSLREIEGGFELIHSQRTGRTPIHLVTRLNQRRLSLTVSYGEGRSNLSPEIVSSLWRAAERDVQQSFGQRNQSSLTNLTEIFFDSNNNLYIESQPRPATQVMNRFRDYLGFE